nr:putative ribonuclease H-like domain-containing protein [Tanacetum cinerariifolium]
CTEVNAAGTLVPAVRQISPNNTNTFSAAGPSNTANCPTHGKSSFINASQLFDDPDMLELEDITCSDDEDDIGAEADFNNLETSITVSPIPTTRVHKDHHVTQIIGDLSLTTQTKSMTRVSKDQGGLSQMFNDDFHTCMFACFLLQEEPKRSKKQDDKTKREAKGKSPAESFIGYRYLSAEFEDYSEDSINEVNAAGTLVPAVRQISPNNTNTFSAAGPSNTANCPTHGKSSFINASQLFDDPDMLELEDITCSDDEDDIGAEADFNNLETSITKVWVLVDLPYGKRAIGTKWVFRNKKDEKGIVARNKARLITQGHTQEEGIDYEEVFAPVARIEAIRLLLAYASFMGFMVYQMNVKITFLYGTTEEEVYVYQPPGFEDPDHSNKVYKVVKALYGLHQALRAWYETLENYLLENGFQRGKINQTLFIKRQKGDILLVQVYVNDIIFGATNKDLCKSFKKLMKDKFQMSSIEELTFFLGLQVKQKKDGIFISQDKYVAEILRKCGLTDTKLARVNTPRSDEDMLELNGIDSFLVTKAKEVVDDAKDDQDADVQVNADIQGRKAES